MKNQRNNSKNKIDIHADDYAVSLHASEDLIACLKEGTLDSISIIPNMSCFEACMRRLHEEWNNLANKPLISVHLNLMEGHCVSVPEKVTDLVDEKGLFKVSWGSLLTASYNPFSYKKIKEQLKKEFTAQINRVQKSLPDGCELRLDSHQHTHMLPIVREAMIAVVDEEKLPVTFIRVAEEPLLPFLRHPGLYPSFGIANPIKNVLLNFYAIGMRKALKKRNLQPVLLWGLMMSGHMDIERIRQIYPDMKAYCDRKGQALEILFHPGTVLPEEINEEHCKAGFVEFHLSEGRKIERQAVDCLQQEVLHS